MNTIGILNKEYYDYEIVLLIIRYSMYYNEYSM